MSVCTVCAHEHELYSPRDVNAHGDVTAIRDGWVRVPRTKARGAPCKYTIVVDWIDGGRWPSRPVKRAVVPQGWWNAKQAAAKRPRRKLPEETLRARRLGVKIGDARACAKRDGVTVGEVLDTIEGERRAEAERLARERRERADLAPAYVRRVAASLVANLDPKSRLSRAFEVLHAINRLAKQPGVKPWDARIYMAKDRLVFPLLRRGGGRLYRFEHPGGLGYCCGRGPIRTGEDCWACGLEVSGRPETWCVAQFVDSDRVYRWHVPPWKVTPELLALAERTEPHDPTQPMREVPPLDLELEVAIALVAHVGDLVAAECALASKQSKEVAHAADGG